MNGSGRGLGLRGVAPRLVMNHEHQCAACGRFVRCSIPCDMTDLVVCDECEQIRCFVCNRRPTPGDLPWDRVKNPRDNTHWLPRVDVCAECAPTV